MEEFQPKNTSQLQVKFQPVVLIQLNFGSKNKDAHPFCNNENNCFET